MHALIGNRMLLFLALKANDATGLFLVIFRSASATIKPLISNNPSLRVGLAQIVPKLQQPAALFGWRDAIVSLLFKKRN